MLAARERYRDRATVPIVRVPQSGVMRCPGVLDLLDTAVRNVADLVGGIDPLEIDRDPKGQLDEIFAIAARASRPKWAGDPMSTVGDCPASSECLAHKATEDFLLMRTRFSLGIDLGTTNSAIALTDLETDQAEVLEVTQILGNRCSAAH
jgi:hypothetical protein